MAAPLPPIRPPETDELVYLAHIFAALERIADAVAPKRAQEPPAAEPAPAPAAKKSARSTRSR